MAFRACAAYHLNPGDGRHYQEILSSQQTDIRAFVSGCISLRTYRLSAFFSRSEIETTIIIGTTPRHLKWPPRCLSIPKP